MVVSQLRCLCRAGAAASLPREVDTDPKASVVFFKMQAKNVSC